MYQNVAENMRQIKKIPRLIGKKGSVIWYSKVMFAPTKFKNQEPYYVALIELENGEKITAQIVDCEKIFEGMKVKGVLRKLFSYGQEGLIQYGVKFRPEFESEKYEVK